MTHIKLRAFYGYHGDAPVEWQRYILDNWVKVSFTEAVWLTDALNRDGCGIESEDGFDDISKRRYREWDGWL